MATTWVVRSDDTAPVRTVGRVTEWRGDTCIVEWPRDAGGVVAREEYSDELEPVRGG